MIKILNELAADNSRLAKEAILRREKDNALLQSVLKTALDPYINYWIKQIPEYTAGKCVPSITLESALKEITLLSDRTHTGNAAINHLGWILQNCSVEDAQVIERVIQRDLKCGVSEATVNKIWSGLIPTFEVMLAYKDISGIKYPAICQCLSGDWIIETDSGHFTIKEIVENKIDVLVKTFDVDNKISLMKPISNWFHQGKSKKLMKFKYIDDNGEVHETPLLTENHLVWNESSGSWVFVNCLSEGDNIIIE